MMIVWIPVITFAGGLAAWGLSLRSRRACRWVALTTLAAVTALTLVLWTRLGSESIFASGDGQVVAWTWTWIPQFGTGVSLAADGLTVLLLLLACVLGMVAIVASWNEIQEKVGFFHFNVMLALAGVMGVFLSLDLFLFYVFWELMLVPMYFLITIWGHERRVYAATRFFIFTQLGGLLMLLSILGLYFIHGRNTGDYTFNAQTLIATKFDVHVAFWLMMGFVAAFFVKLPVIPVHTWLPDAYSEAPTGGSILLAGIVSKAGAYGLIRFVLPLFPAASYRIAPVAMVLGAIGVIYGAILAFAQKDIRRLIAYTSLSHLGFVLLGIFAGTQTALEGSIVIIVAHGLSTGGLFAVAGALRERLDTRQMDAFGGLWASMPRMGGVALFFALASLGLPGLANFVGEFLVLAGSYANYPIITIIATLGFIVSTIYSLWLIYQVFYGPQHEESSPSDLGLREAALFGVLIILIVAIGIRPQPILDTVASVPPLAPDNVASQTDGDMRTETPSAHIISGIMNDTE